MSLIELMVSVAIGLIITLAISTLFLNTGRSNKENSATALMQENARFALETIASDLRHAGFFGNVQDPDTIADNGVTMPANTDCGSTTAGAYMLDFSGSKLIGYSTALSNNELDATIAPCTMPSPPSGTTRLSIAQNTLLTIKRVSSSGIAYNTFLAMATADKTGRIYVHSNGGTASLGSGAATPIPQTTVQVWDYMPRYYYVTHTKVVENGRDIYKHTLYRSTFSLETGGVWLDEPLAEGIERFHIEFGIDSDDDGTPNYFSDVPATIDVAGIVSARIHVLARTTAVDRNYSDLNNTYKLGSLTVIPSTDATNIDPDKTQYHRQVYSTTVTIPNLRRRHTLN